MLELALAGGLPAAVPVATAPPPIVDVGVGTPELSPTLDAEEAPEKAAAPVVAEAEGIAMVMLGLRTLSMTWTTPLAIRTSGVTTFALLTKVVPLFMVMVRFMPAMDLSIVLFVRVEL